MPILRVDHVTKTFRQRRGARALLGRGGIGDVFRGRRASTFTALEDVSFDVEPGESLGLIGSNGSGKSTLLKIIAGVSVPTTGHVYVEGRVASLLELGAGFHSMLTGRENVYLNAGLLGMRHAQVDAVFDAIVEFSGIGAFIDNPVDTYSSGMYVRIAFAVAAHVDPDIFLIDEVLAVGDEEFQRKCRTRIGELKEQGKTIVFVSHDLGTVNTLCDRVVLLSKGRMISRGTPQRTIEYYLRQVGRDEGIHTLREDSLEAIVSNGRISVFKDQVELTAPAGLQLQLTVLNQYHNSTSGDWRIVERSHTRCVARGRMLRIPVVAIWTVELEQGVLRWNIELECERDVHVDMIDVQLPWPLSYTHWLSTDTECELPDILPTDQSWALIVPAEAGSYSGALLADGPQPPPITVDAVDAKTSYGMQVFNQDYISGARLVQFSSRFAEVERPLKAGRYPVFSIQLRTDLSPDAIRAEARQRRELNSVISGAARAQFSRGAIEVTHDGKAVTSGVHFHTECLISNLWVFSQGFVWDEVARHGASLSVSGTSRRFPLRQVWTVHEAGDGFDLRVDFDVLAPLTVQEYNISIGIVGGYTHWTTEHESGVFSESPPDQSEWAHVNTDYSPGAHVGAVGAGLPAVTLVNLDSSLPTHMTALNSGFGQPFRILQALCVPGQSGGFRFEPGRQTAFVGHLRIGGT